MTGLPTVDTNLRSQSLFAILIGGYATAIAVAPTTTVAFGLAAPLICIPLAGWTIAEPQRWIALFLGAALLLPPLPIAGGDSGPHVAVIFVVLGLFAGLVRLPEWCISFDPATVGLLAFSCVLLASVAPAAWFSGEATALGSLARVALFGIGVFVYLYTAHGPTSIFSDPMKAARALFFVAVIAAVFACLDFYYQLPAPAGYGPQFVWLDAGVFRRAQGFFYEASTLGNFCAFFLVMIAVALFPPKGVRRFSRLWLVAGGVVLSAALIFSYSRASLLNLAVSLAMLAYVRRVRLKRLALALAACISAGALVVYSVFPSFASSYWLRLSGSFQYFWSSPDGILSGRLGTWRVLLAFLVDHPWHAIFGIGYKTLPYSEFVGRTVIADNTYLSLLVETGIIGLLVFLVLNFGILRAGLKASRSSMATAAFFGTWIVCFWAGQIAQMFSGDLITYWRVLPVYWWVLAVAVRESRAV